MIVKPETKIEELSIEEKVALIIESDGYLIELLSGCIVDNNLFLRGLNDLTYIPGGLEVKGGLWLEYCNNLEKISDNLKVGGSLHLYGCNKLKEVPKTINVKRNIHLPNHLKINLK